MRSCDVSIIGSTNMQLEVHKPTEDGIVTLIDGSTHNIPAVVVSGGNHTCILDFLYLTAISTFFLPFFLTALKLGHSDT